MKLYFYRHLPTTNNLNDVFIGRLDLECDEAFIINNKNKISESIRNNGFTKIYCSPLKRAIQSVELFFPGKSYTIDERLTERDLGDWSNVPKNQVRHKYPLAFYDNGRLNFNFTPPNGEKYSDLLSRVSSFLMDIYDSHEQEEDVIVVTHNGVITAVKCLVNGDSNTEAYSFQPFLKEYSLELNDYKMNRVLEIIKKYDL